jgi:hypothetical protein
MSDGTISGNIADSGGGVYVLKEGTFTMSGGEISGNSGGGVYVREGAFTMSGGTVYGSDAGDKANKSSWKGGAALYCGDRNRAKYGNGALILEGYRVNYIDETLTGKK